MFLCFSMFCFFLKLSIHGKLKTIGLIFSRFRNQNNFKSHADKTANPWSLTCKTSEITTLVLRFRKRDFQKLEHIVEENVSQISVHM